MPQMETEEAALLSTGSFGTRTNKDSLIIHEQFQGTSSARTHE